jgi:hypothetical protein
VAAILLLIIVTASYLVIRIGALALELTGFESERASFQALSAFTNSGFTTRESEEVVIVTGPAVSWRRMRRFWKRSNPLRVVALVRVTVTAFSVAPST